MLLNAVKRKIAIAIYLCRVCVANSRFERTLMYGEKKKSCGFYLVEFALQTRDLCEPWCAVKRKNPDGFYLVEFALQTRELCNFNKEPSPSALPTPLPKGEAFFRLSLWVAKRRHGSKWQPQTAVRTVSWPSRSEIAPTELGEKKKRWRNLSCRFVRTLVHGEEKCFRV